MRVSATHVITPIEAACGVTLEAVALELPRGLFIENGARITRNCRATISRDMLPLISMAMFMQLAMPLSNRA